MHANKVVHHYSPCLIYRTGYLQNAKCMLPSAWTEEVQELVLKIVIEEKMLLCLLRELGIFRLVAESAGRRSLENEEKRLLQLKSPLLGYQTWHPTALDLFHTHFSLNLPWFPSLQNCAFRLPCLLAVLWSRTKYCPDGFIKNTL